MRLISFALLAAALMIVHNGPSLASDARVLARGINITRWASFAGSKPISFYHDYVAALPQRIADLGFSYVRVPISPKAVQSEGGRFRSDVAEAIVMGLHKFQQAGLGVMVVPMDHGWDLQHREADQQELLSFWRDLSPFLGKLDPALLFVEVLNEPRFNQPAAWDDLQEHTVTMIRYQLPHVTIVATGTDWSKIAGLETVKILEDKNVVYSFHYYQPQILTSMFHQLPDGDKISMKYMPFPIENRDLCRRVTEQEGLSANTRRMVEWYCDHDRGAQQVADNIARIARWAQAHGVVTINTEFGIRSDRSISTRAAYLRAVREACERAGIGWGLWGYDDGFGFSLQPADALNDIPQELLAALGLSSRH